MHYCSKSSLPALLWYHKWCNSAAWIDRRATSRTRRSESRHPCRWGSKGACIFLTLVRGYRSHEAGRAIGLFCLLDLHTFSFVMEGGFHSLCTSSQKDRLVRRSWISLFVNIGLHIRFQGVLKIVGSQHWGLGRNSNLSQGRCVWIHCSVCVFRQIEYHQSAKSRKMTFSNELS